MILKFFEINKIDLNKNNIYNVGLKATDFAGNISNQLLDIYLISDHLIPSKIFF